MQISKNVMLVFMIAVLFFGGMAGFSNYEGFGAADSFHAVVGALTFSGSSDYSDRGRMLNSVLSLASVAIIAWAFANMRGSSAPEEPEGDMRNSFNIVPHDEGIIVKEVRILAGSSMAGKTKIHVLEKSGSLVMAIKKKREFKLSVPFDKKLSAGTSVLAFGTQSQIKDFEMRARK